MTEWLREPLAPLIVTVKRCPRARLRARTVRVDDVDVVGFGENDSLRPDELSVADNETAPLKFWREIVTAYCVVDVRPIAADDGVTEIPKSPVWAAWTTSVAGAVWFGGPAPVTENPYELAVSDEVVVTVIVAVCEPAPLTDAGLNEADAPVGRPVVPRVTLPVNPFDGVTVTVYDAEPPCVTVCDVGLTVTE